MKLRPTIHTARHIYSSACLPSPLTLLRHASTLSNLPYELISRPLNITYDYLSPTPSHLLNVSLRDFFPSSCYSKYFNANNITLPRIASPQKPHPLHQGHHLVYFPPAIPHHGLLPDGTDTLHSPPSPTPFTRRLWAGGSVTFHPSPQSRLYLNGARVACVEGIRDVTIKGKAGDEKIFVRIERRYGYVNPSRGERGRHVDDENINDEDVIKRVWIGDQAAVAERRNLVFLRARENVKLDEAIDERVVKRVFSALYPARDHSADLLNDPIASHTADFSISLTPPPSLLFRFSALTFNAHLIHLDPRYSREVEGHRNLLVHGPLSLVLMLSVLQSQLKDGEMITSFTYRNLAPLYAQEEMRVCLRKDREDGKKYEVWIEGMTGGYAVKSSATVGPME